MSFLEQFFKAQFFVRCGGLDPGKSTPWKVGLIRSTNRYRYRPMEKETSFDTLSIQPQKGERRGGVVVCSVGRLPSIHL